MNSYKCRVEGCTNRVKAKGLCAKHYARLRAHGDINADFRKGQRVISPPCSVEGCSRLATSSKSAFCNIHYLRKYRHGSVESRIPNYGRGWHIHKQGYIRLTDGSLEHVFLAERALGRKLPPKAVVHHMNNNPADNHTPFNLIICPDQAYHFLLHKRARELGYTGFIR